MTKGNLEEKTLVFLIMAVLVERLGGSVTITQDDIDSVSYGGLHERCEGEDAPLTLTYIKKALAS